MTESMTDCCIFETSTYEMNGSKRQRHTLDTPYDPYPRDPHHVTTLDEYYWLRKSKSDTFYGLGRLGLQFILFVFHCDDLKETSKLKLTYATSREALVDYAMSARVYTRYIKDTASI